MATVSDSFRITRLGPPALISPLTARFSAENFLVEDTRVVAVSDAEALSRALATGGGLEAVPTLERAGPRAKVYFDGASITCGIVTCGGLCPGLNNVIRSVVLTLWHGYGVRRILGFQYGFAGLSGRPPEPAMELDPERVQGIHEHGGTLLGTSRGPQDVGEMVDTLARDKVSVLFAVGGDGTLRGASAIAREAMRRHLRLAVIGIPKTIDNDLSWIERSFGFATAVEHARLVIAAAHSEAKGVLDGIGLVRLMGRHSGFIAAHASLASNDVNFCMVPEVAVHLDGDHGLLRALDLRLQARRHAVVVVAEGALQDVLQDPQHIERDASGNVKLVDNGLFLRERIRSHFAGLGRPLNVRYFDPSYVIRSQAPAAVDAEYCLRLSQQAVHAGMSGRTDMVVGYWNQRFTHVPIARAVEKRKQIDPNGALWRAVLEATGQRQWYR
ncbi:MAG: ATP-dependent 6-phosphofructokinase [Planctomycetota bacterium]